ncbi:MAG: DUF2520 domain-containing protein [Flavobacteriales bacterium]
MKFSIIGSGNVAYHFAAMWGEQGHLLQQVVARNKQNAQQLADAHHAECIDAVKSIRTDIDCVLIAVNDDAIHEVSKQLSPELFAIHTSGFTGMDVLTQQRKGVIWPVMSLTKNNPTDYSIIPFLIEASGAEELDKIKNWMSKVSKNIIQTTSEGRRTAHLAATISNNFSNALLDIAHQQLTGQQLSLQLLLPMLSAQLKKLEQHRPSEIQTGPSRRGDMMVIQTHLDMLRDSDAQEVYEVLSNYLLNKYHGKKL